MTCLANLWTLLDLRGISASVVPICECSYISQWQAENAVLSRLLPSLQFAHGDLRKLYDELMYDESHSPVAKIVGTGGADVASPAKARDAPSFFRSDRHPAKTRDWGSGWGREQREEQESSPLLVRSWNFSLIIWFLLKGAGYRVDNTHWDFVESNNKTTFHTSP